MYNNHSDFNDENNLYHYSYRDSSQQPPQEPVQDLKPHKEKKPAPRWAKITAIILAGAIVSGACGYGGAMLANHASYGSTTITQSSRTASAVTVKKVDGQTAMSPAEVYASTVNSVVSINCSSTSTNIFGQSTESAASSSPRTATLSRTTTSSAARRRYPSRSITAIPTMPPSSAATATMMSPS